MEAQHTDVTQLNFLLESYKTLALKIQSLGLVIQDPFTMGDDEVNLWLTEVEERKEELDILSTLTLKVLGLSNGSGRRLW